MTAALDADFFARDTRLAAEELIGATLRVGRCAGRIVETEAYRGDPASHVVTRPRTAGVMSTTHGHLYVYSIYGLHNCVNITTEEGAPGAVLLRAVAPTEGQDLMRRRRARGLGRTPRDHEIASGPARLVVAFGIKPGWSGRRLDDVLTIEPRRERVDVVSAPRVGISRAKDLPWRFCERSSAHVSRPRPWGRVRAGATA